MNFEELLISAKGNDPKAKNEILDMYRPLLIKEALISGVFDENLYQELQEILLQIIKVFKI